VIEILKLILSGAGGGVIGLVGAWLKAKEENKRFDLETARLEKVQAHEMALVGAKMDASAQEWAGRAFDSSQRLAAPSDRTPPWALALGSVMRPLLTCTLIAFAVYCYRETPDSVARVDLARDAFALCGMAVGWWFGSRPSLRATQVPPRGTEQGEALPRPPARASG
jgi:hypothetical protein